MSNFFEKTFYAGLGLASLTVDAIEKMAKDIAKERDLSEEEGRKLYQQLKERSQKERQKIEEQVDGMVKKTLERMDIPTKSHIQELQEKIDILEARLAAKKTENKAQKAQNKSGE